MRRDAFMPFFVSPKSQKDWATEGIEPSTTPTLTAYDTTTPRHHAMGINDSNQLLTNSRKKANRGLITKADQHQCFEHKTTKE